MKFVIQKNILVCSCYPYCRKFSEA